MWFIMFFLNIYTIVEKIVRYSFLFTTKKKKTRPIGLHFILQFYKKKKTLWIYKWVLFKANHFCVRTTYRVHKSP